MEVEINTPSVLYEFLTKHNCLDMIYKAMENEDLSEVVFAARDALKQSALILKPIPNRKKSVIQSTLQRNQGNQAYLVGDYRKALECYNLALLNSPYQSEAMKLAYSNRSAVLFAAKMYGACIRDIHTCLELGFIDHEIVDKLNRRRMECLHHLPKEEIENMILNSFFHGQFLSINGGRNPQIPSASSSVKIVNESKQAQVVASRDIEVGTVVALETAFVTEIHPQYRFMTCHYCLKIAPNLIPCDNCCIALFCDEKCRTLCNAEYHYIECQIADLLENRFRSLRMKIRTVLKMKQMCQSWDELIKASHTMGKRKMKDSSVGEIYDVKNMFSMLNSDSPPHFIYGAMFNMSCEYASVLNALKKVPLFLPKSKSEKIEAMRALARIMMHLHLSQTTVEIYNSAMLGMSSKQVEIIHEPNWGYFPFTSKLNHRCEANLLVVGLNNKLALIAEKPITKGDELNISYIGHFYEQQYISRQGPENDLRRLKLFATKEAICGCQVCRDKWNAYTFKESKLSIEETAAFKKWFALKDRPEAYYEGGKYFFHLTCQTLGQLSKSPWTKEYFQVFHEFRASLSYCQCVTTGNVVFLD